MAYDLVIRNGMIVDGSGLAAYAADVGISGPLITKIGAIREQGLKEIDAQGHVVTPGFIDGHTHMDAQIFWDSLGTCSCWHGVTTAVMGHCGFTLAPASKNQRHLVMSNFERAEDIPAVAMESGIDWTWTTFAEYLDAVERIEKGINYVANVGHSALRTHAMGERAFVEEATTADLELMAKELRSALLAGASGFTTSRTTHETPDGRPVASRIATWDEVRYLVNEMSMLGGGIFQLVERRFTEDAEQSERSERLIALSAETDVPIAIVAPARPEERVLELLDSAAASGAHLFGLTNPRGIYSYASFRTHLPFDHLPEWEIVRDQPLEQQRLSFRDPDVRQRLVWAAHHGTYARAIGPEYPTPDFSKMRVLDQPCPPNPTVAELAQARRIDPVELILDLALETDFNQFFYQMRDSFNYDATKTVLKHPLVVPTLSDAGAHVSQISDCSIHTYLLEYWVRNRQEFTLEQAVRMVTSAPCRLWGINNRGLLREQFVADINVFDPQRVGPAMPTVVHDLPGGGPRIKQTAHGFLATLVRGQIVHFQGEHTGALPGELIRRPLAAVHR